MKLYLILLFSMVFIFTCNSQVEIGMPQFYKGYGVVVKPNPLTNNFLNDSIQSICISLKDLERAEAILQDSLKAFTNSPYFNKKSVKDRYWYYNRQYYSYLREDKDTIVMIHLLNFKHKRKAKKHFQLEEIESIAKETEKYFDWRKYQFYASGEFYEKNVRFYKVNLSKRKIISLLGINEL